MSFEAWAAFAAASAVSAELSCSTFAQSHRRIGRVAPFLLYGVAALVGVNNRWGIGSTILGISLAVVPYATIPFEIRAEKAGRLDGAWRRTATSDPRDAHWFDRLYRWFLNRPVFFALILLVSIVAIFATLIIIGPPGGWPVDEG